MDGQEGACQFLPNTQLLHCRVQRDESRLVKILLKLATKHLSLAVVVMEPYLLCQLCEAALPSPVDRILPLVAQHSFQVTRLIAGPRTTVAHAEAGIQAQSPAPERLPFTQYQANGETSLQSTQSRAQLPGITWSG